MANQVIFNFGWVMDKVCAYTMKGHDRDSMSIDDW